MIAGNTGNVVCNTSFTNLSDRVKTEMAKADAAELQLFDSVDKQYKRPAPQTTSQEQSGHRLHAPAARSKWSLHCPPLRATLLARSFFSVWMPRSTTAMALLSRSGVHKVPVVPRQLPQRA